MIRHDGPQGFPDRIGGDWFGFADGTSAGGNSSTSPGNWTGAGRARES